MTIDWNSFTPWQSLAGGAVIGAAAALLWLGTGRIAGVSGIVGGLLRPRSGQMGWRLAFAAGVLAAPAVWSLVAALPAMRVQTGYPVLVAAGLLVGLGTRFAGGCTSGHGVCGLSRLSVRSLAATAAFMGAGFATVYLVRHALVA